MGKVMISGVAPQMKRPVSYKVNFADNDWYTIIDACKKNAVPETWLVGDQKTMTINGTDYLIDIIGKNHDDYADGSGKAPLTFQMHDCYGTKYAMNVSSSPTNVGGWGSSLMRTTHLPSVKALMPVEVQSGLRLVNKKTSEGNTSSAIVTTSDDLFLLSELEVFGSVTNSFDGEGSQYAYYAAGNSKIKSVPYYGDSFWWNRSPRKTNTYSFCGVGNTGNPSHNSDGEQGVSFAFCF